MKKLIIFLSFITIVSGILAQAPGKMSYQALVRDSNNKLIPDSNIGMQVSILQGTTNGTAVFIERHFPSTNSNGLATVEIGGGTLISGGFMTIDWANGPYFIKTETDLNGGANYTISGTSQFLSVPYALHAKTVETGDDWGSQAIITDETLSGDGILGNPLKLTQQGAEANHVLQYNGSSIFWGYAPGSEIQVAVFNVDCKVLASFATSYQKISNFGTINKLDATSKLEVTFNGRIYAETLSGSGAKFEIRVDDQATTNGRARAVLKSSEVGIDGMPVSITGVFTGFDTGNHTISIWVVSTFNSGTEAMVDPGCWSSDHIIVREIK